MNIPIIPPKNTPQIKAITINGQKANSSMKKNM